MCSRYFFFQAEDGIRDWSVTGVQTCALPICLRKEIYEPGDSRDVNISIEKFLGQPTSLEPFLKKIGIGQKMKHLINANVTGRSEERRVGKGCRSRWTRHDTKNRHCIHH